MEWIQYLKVEINVVCWNAWICTHTLQHSLYRLLDVPNSFPKIYTYIYMYMYITDCIMPQWSCLRLRTLSFAAQQTTMFSKRELAWGWQPACTSGVSATAHVAGVLGPAASVSIHTRWRRVVTLYLWVLIKYLWIPCLDIIIYYQII